MTQDSTFVKRIHAKYPEGLTGIFAIGGTRTTYILEKQAKQNSDPGRIEDFQDYATYGKLKHMELISSFVELGGRNIIIPTLAYQRFANYSEEYTEYISQFALELIDTEMVEFYSEQDFDPYFVGIDTLLQLPKSSPAYQLGIKLTEFQNHHEYNDENNKIIWEIAPIPLFSIHNSRNRLGEESRANLDAKLETVDDLRTMHTILYRHYCKAIIGTEIPYPHFYVGSNKNGDLKMRTMSPMSLFSGEDFRMFFLPYPSLFMTKETLQVIIEDLAFGERMRSFNKDYAGKYDVELVQQEYQRIMALRSDPTTTLGLTRQVKPTADT